MKSAREAVQDRRTERAWDTFTSQFIAALGTVAIEETKGGDPDFVTGIMNIAQPMPGKHIPNREAIANLEELFPGASTKVFEEMARIDASAPVEAPAPLTYAVKIRDYGAAVVHVALSAAG